MDFQAQNQQRFATAIRRFDEENARDPNREQFEGRGEPRELLFSRRLTDWVLRLAPHASEALRLAARSQHLCRWMIPRDSFPPNRAGYLKWREELKRYHAQRSGEILREAGYDEGFIARVQDLNLKKNFPNDPESRIMEDALCLVFLEHQFADLAARTSDDKIINALRKSWAKMTSRARDLALTLNYAPRQRELLDRALPPV